MIDEDNYKKAAQLAGAAARHNTPYAAIDWKEAEEDQWVDE